MEGTDYRSRYINKIDYIPIDVVFSDSNKEEKEALLKELGGFIQCIKEIKTSLFGTMVIAVCLIPERRVMQFCYPEDYDNS